MDKVTWLLHYFFRAKKCLTLTKVDYDPWGPGATPRQRIAGAKAYCTAPERCATFARLGPPTGNIPFLVRAWCQEECVRRRHGVLGDYPGDWNA